MCLWPVSFRNADPDLNLMYLQSKLSTSGEHLVIAQMNLRPVSLKIESLSLNSLDNECSNFVVRCTFNSKSAIYVLLVCFRTSLEEFHSNVSIAFANGMMQSRHPVGIGSIDWTFVFDQQLHDRHTTYRCRTMKRQLATLVLDSCASSMF